MRSYYNRLTSLHIQGCNDRALKERLAPLQPLARKIIDNAVKERQATLPPHEFIRGEENIGHDFLRREDKVLRCEKEIVQSQNNPMKLGFVKQVLLQSMKSFE